MEVLGGRGSQERGVLKGKRWRVKADLRSRRFIVKWAGEGGGCDGERTKRVVGSEGNKEGRKKKRKICDGGVERDAVEVRGVVAV